MFAIDYQFLSDIGGSCLGLVFFFFLFLSTPGKTEGRLDGQHSQGCCYW